MAVYPYPCGCNTAVVSSTAANCENCIFVPDVVIAQDANLLPCGIGGAASTVDVAALPETKLTAATGVVTWELLSSAFDQTKFASISIDSAGVITFKFSTTPAVGDLVIVVGRVRDAGTGLSSIFEIKIPVYNTCLYSQCASNETCNPCTGDCDTITQDITVG